MSRDDFKQKDKDTLSKRVGARCSNPKCCTSTSGPHSNPTTSINVGVAAHITAASAGGARYDRSLSTEQRTGTENGIWLCQKCAKLIDNDEDRYTVEILKKWKEQAETKVLDELEGKSAKPNNSENKVFEKLESLMPELLAEMREDLSENRLKREFVLLKKSWSYWAKGNELIYYFDDHPELQEKIQILENYDLVNNITYNNVERFVFQEPFAEYLSG